MKTHISSLSMFVITIFFLHLFQAIARSLSQSLLVNTSHNATAYNASKFFSSSFEFLSIHNLVRATHLEFPLIWDSRLEAHAKWWAGQRKGDCALRHSFPEGDFTLGENIFWGSGSQWSAADAVRDWADEVKYYSYSSNTCKEGEECGHYTQIVWRKTWKLGCARVICDNGDVFITCNYDPPGNYVGERPY